MKRFVHRFVGLCVGLSLAACGGTGENGDTGGLAGACGLGCPGDTVQGVKLAGVAEGSSSISGIQKVDSFFSAVLGFQAAANGVSDGIQAELDQIRADFGIKPGADLKAELQKQFDANLSAKVDIDYQPARCVVDAQATLEASAKCDVSVMGGKAEVECKGSCEAEVSANVMCDANAELRCTVTAPSVKCEGECRGSCTTMLNAAARCDGNCTGTCSGNCSAYSDSAGTKCAGICDGMCTGSCDVQLEAAASCSGSCRGECTVTKPSGGCEGGIRAECRAKADASFMCSGRCTGDFEPPKVSADCEATAKAQASVNVQCTPPRLVAHYAIKAGADVKFRPALDALIDVRLPKLLEAVGKAKLVGTAGEGLAVAATGAVKGLADELKANGKLQLKVVVGAQCALEELPKAKDLVEDANDKLITKLNDTKSLTAMLGFDA